MEETKVSVCFNCINLYCPVYPTFYEIKSKVPVKCKCCRKIISTDKIVMITQEVLDIMLEHRSIK